MKTNEMSELANRIKRQFQLAIGEKMLENYLDVKGERVISDIIFSGSIKSEHINLFPCEIPGSCASEAVFISLSSEKNKKEFTSLKEDQFISEEYRCCIYFLEVEGRFLLIYFSKKLLYRFSRSFVQIHHFLQTLI
jgi:hypothetical protein